MAAPFVIRPTPARRLATAAFIFLAAVGAARAQAMRDAAGVDRELPKPAIILFWAPWCAPCRVETRNLGELTRAAGSTPVVVVPMDDDRRTRDALSGVAPSRVLFARGGGYRLLRRWAPDASGLPVSIALNSVGGVCAAVAGALTIDDVRRLGIACAQKPHA